MARELAPRKEQRSTRERGRELDRLLGLARPRPSEPGLVPDRVLEPATALAPERELAPQRQPRGVWEWGTQAGRELGFWSVAEPSWANKMEFDEGGPQQAKGRMPKTCRFDRRRIRQWPKKAYSSQFVAGGEFAQNEVGDTTVERLVLRAQGAALRYVPRDTRYARGCV